MNTSGLVAINAKAENMEWRFSDSNKKDRVNAHPSSATADRGLFFNVVNRCFMILTSNLAYYSTF